MTNSNYKDDLAKARTILDELLEQREAVETAIAKQRLRIAALASLVNDNEEANVALEAELGGLTDAVRTAFRSAKSLTPVQVRNRLIELGFPVHKHKNIMASIHTVIRRLYAAGEISPFGDVEFGGYQWVGSKVPPNHPLQRLRWRPNKTTATQALTERLAERDKK